LEERPGGNKKTPFSKTKLTPNSPEVLELNGERTALQVSIFGIVLLEQRGSRNMSFSIQTRMLAYGLSNNIY
jgi:hypothetical protein